MNVLPAIAGLLLDFRKGGAAGVFSPLVTVVLVLSMPANDVLCAALPMTVGIEPRRFVATSAVYFAVIYLIKVPGSFIADILGGELILSTIWSWVPIPVGVGLGRLLVTRIDRALFEHVLLRC